MGNLTQIEFTEYATPDGETYSLNNQSRFLMTEMGLGMPDIKWITTKGPYQHGETVVDYRLEPRIIQMLLRQNSCDREKYWDNREQILDILRPNRYLLGNIRPGTLKKTLANGKRRWIDVFLEKGPTFEARNLNQWDEFAFTETIRFRAPDPTFYDPTPVCLQFTLAISQQLSFPASFPIQFGGSAINTSISTTVLGNWISYPSIYIHGPLSSLKITNESTNQIINLKHAISGDKSCTIVLAYGNKSATMSTGENIFNSLTGDIATFCLAPSPLVTGGINTLRVVGIGANLTDTIVEVTYYNRYIGI